MLGVQLELELAASNICMSRKALSSSQYLNLGPSEYQSDAFTTEPPELWTCIVARLIDYKSILYWSSKSILHVKRHVHVKGHVSDAPILNKFNRSYRYFIVQTFCVDLRTVSTDTCISTFTQLRTTCIHTTSLTCAIRRSLQFKPREAATVI